MAKKKNQEDKPRISSSDIKLNNTFTDIFDRISSNTYKSPLDNIRQIDMLEKKIDDVISSDIDKMKEYAGNDLSTFLYKTLAANDRKYGNNTISANGKGKSEGDIDEIFNSKDSSLFALFSERFKNKALLFKDLEIISEQLVEITEALNTTRDDIVCSDDIGADIARSINFTTDTADREKYDDLIDEVKMLEKEYKLNHKIREHIVPKTLKYGEYYVYIIPEAKLFQRSQQTRSSQISTTLESSDIQTILENLELDDNTKIQDNVIKESLSNIYVSNDEIVLPLLEDTNTMNAMMDLKKYNRTSDLFKPRATKKSKKENNFTGFSDGVKSTNKLEDWSDVKGCYIKLLDPKKVIPVKIMDHIIGYYYVNDSDIDPASHNCGSRKTPSMRGNLLDTIAHKSSNERNIVAVLANSIVKSFDKEYLKNNSEFKDLIINSLLYNDMYKRKLHYQFIPADHICRFSVNEDEHGNGCSMLYKSLFYAKLYLSMLIFNIITYLSKSQDTRVHYVKQSGIDKNIINKCMEVARGIKAKQISIADLMDYSSIYGKIGTGRDVFMPVGESGERGIEFDVIGGQQVDMQPEVMEQLKQAYINGTGVPSVIMNYINEADFAKTLVMANAKHMRRVMLYQDSFSESITKMYKMIMLYSTDMELDTIQDFEYRLQRPKSLPNNNLVDIMGYGDQILEFLDKAVYGQYSDDRFDPIEKDLFREEMARKVLPMMPWELVDEVLEDIKIKLAAEKAKTKDSSSEDDNGGGSTPPSNNNDDFGGGF